MLNGKKCEDFFIIFNGMNAKENLKMETKKLFAQGLGPHKKGTASHKTA